MTMIEDPIVEELHRIREKTLEEHGGLEGLVKHLRQIQPEMPERVVHTEASDRNEAEGRLSVGGGEAPTSVLRAQPSRWLH